MSSQTSSKQEGNASFTDPYSFLFSPVNSTLEFIEFISAVLFSILRASCVPAELIFRRGFGERHFNLWLYSSGGLWLILFASGWINIPKWLGYNVTGWMPNFAIFSIVGIFFFGSLIWELMLRKFRKINRELHTRYDGNPLPFLFKLPFAKDKNGNPKEYFVRQVYEPLFLILLGIIITITLNPQTGSWLFISALGMALKEYVKSRYTRNALLDLFDAEIASQNMKAALAGDSTEKTQGIYIAGLLTDEKQRKRLKDYFAKKTSSHTTDIG